MIFIYTREILDDKHRYQSILGLQDQSAKFFTSVEGMARTGLLA